MHRGGCQPECGLSSTGEEHVADVDEVHRPRRPLRGRSAGFLCTPSELVSIHGLDISPAVLGRLTARQVRGLVGNSMHVAQIGAFVQFALAARTRCNDQ